MHQIVNMLNKGGPHGFVQEFPKHCTQNTLKGHSRVPKALHSSALKGHSSALQSLALKHP